MGNGVKRKERAAALAECGLFVELCQYDDGSFEVSVISRDDEKAQITLARGINMEAAIESAAKDLERVSKLPYLLRLPQEAESP